MSTLFSDRQKKKSDKCPFMKRGVYRAMSMCRDVPLVVCVLQVLTREGNVDCFEKEQKKLKLRELERMWKAELKAMKC